AKETYKAKTAKPTKYHQYTLPGGQNYRELLMTLPERGGLSHAEAEERYGLAAKGSMRTAEQEARFRELHARYEAARDTSFRASHWDEPNVLAHVRFDDRTGPNGEKVLHVAEIQSDWHQKGRREGYATDPNERTRIVDKLNRGEPLTQEEEAARMRLLRGEGVPDAPFKTTWHELAFKRILRYGAEHGYDRVSWDTGETNAARYDLSKQVESIKTRVGAHPENFIVDINTVSGSAI